ncbi:MAG: hypothetical protein K1X78_10185 [Verrucomicrobiaceae bacterium]|nr:hypothetical protein [Verrucomicrobiaceae bacterium]
MPSLPAKLFSPLFTSSFVAGWVVGLCRLKTGRAEREGASLSRASVAGLITAIVACLAAHAASMGPRGASSLPLSVAAAFLALGMLPSAMFATFGAGFANAIPRWIGALVAGVMILVWPAGYLIGRMVEKKPVTLHTAQPVVAPPPKPSPRYAKPKDFDAANAWKRTVLREDVISDMASGSPLVLSRSEQRIAFVSSVNGKLLLTVRHLYASDQDRAVGLAGGAVALGWSPDDSRLVSLGGDGVFSVCEPERGSLIPLPIPKIKSSDVSGFVWWQAEDVLVISRRGEPQMLSLDTLRLMPTSQHQGWAALKDADRRRIVGTADMPPLHSGDKLRYSLDASGDARSLMAHDTQALYGRVLAANLAGVRQAFSNRDGSILFLAERERLRSLYIGLRDAPTLRFVAESREDFPATDAAKAAIKDRSIECLIAPPIINPLNGKTVSGDVEHAKGLARVIAADGKTATVWVTEERAPIHEGDVVMLPRAALPNGGALLSPTWFAVLTKADASQDIPRREIEKPPVAAVTTKPDAPPATPVTEKPPATSPVQSPAPKAEPMLIIPPKKTEPHPPPTMSAEDKVRQLVVRHHEALSKHDLDGVLDTCGAIATINGKDHTRAEVRSTLIGIFSQKSRIVESVDGEIDVRRGQNSRFTASYDFVFEASIPHGDDERGYGHIDMDVLLTTQGPKMVKKSMRVLRVDKLRGK